MWSRHGPEIDVNDATRAANRGSVTACQAWIAPQSWASRWTGSVGAHRVEDGREVVGQPIEAVARPGGGRVGGARAAHVVGDDPVVGGEVGGDAVPDAVVVGVAVHGDDRGRRGVATLLHRQADAVAHPQTSGHRATLGSRPRVR